MMAMTTSSSIKVNARRAMSGLTSGSGNSVATFDTDSSGAVAKTYHMGGKLSVQYVEMNEPLASQGFRNAVDAMDSLKLRGLARIRTGE